MNEKTAVTLCLNHPVYRLRSISVLRLQSELKCNKNASSTSRIAQVVHIRYFILKMSKILHRVRFIVGIFFPWSLILLRLFYADFVRFILSTLYGVFYRHCTVYFTDIVRFNLLTLYGLFYRHCTVYLTYIVRCI